MNSQNLTLSEAAALFLTSLLLEVREANQREVHRFVRWYGWERQFSGLTAPEVANYAEQLSLSDTDYLKKLDLVKAFLVYAKKKGWSESNLATHLKPKKRKTLLPSATKRGLSETIALTQQKYAELEAELATLKSKRSQVIDEIHRAAADKDFRENAPLEAAREQRGRLEGRIRELEGTLESAVIIGEEKQITHKASIGDTIILRDLACNEELRYMIVSPREVDPTRGKISSESPIGKAVIGRGQGEVIEVAAPAGRLRYQIKQIER